MQENYRYQHHRLARTLRKQQTPAEQCLWALLRKRQVAGFRFRRQAPIGRYIADFACFEVKLIIELDGEIHWEQREYDHIRDEWFRCQGFYVLRFHNEQVFEEIKQTMKKIQQVLTQLQAL